MKQENTSVSVIINTLNRPAYLKKTLESLLSQTEKNFEVIVIDQSDDKQTEELCNKFTLKYHRSTVRNLAISRNLGIEKAAGRFIAFIDDDATADKNWIKSIVDSFSKTEVAGVGGLVLNVSKEPAEVQFQNGIVSSYGNIIDIREISAEDYSKGKYNWYSRAMGANMAFCKDIIKKIGGFDEFYEYLNEETDLAVRIVKAGYRFVYNSNMVVHHLPAPSHNRRGEFDLNWYAHGKNDYYFALKNGHNYLPFRIVRANWRMLAHKGPFLALIKLFLTRKISVARFLKYFSATKWGFLKGLFAGLFSNRKLKRFEVENNEMLHFSKK